MTTPFGGSISDEIMLTRDEARDVLFALDDAIEAAPHGPLRERLEHATPRSRASILGICA